MKLKNEMKYKDEQYVQGTKKLLKNIDILLAEQKQSQMKTKE